MKRFSLFCIAGLCGANVWASCPTNYVSDPAYTTGASCAGSYAADRVYRIADDGNCTTSEVAITSGVGIETGTATTSTIGSGTYSCTAS